ncbi:MAG: ribosome maturation factor RimM [Erysipelotrichaceae bacterium]|nr:ribosome maturation factor RimM [Erysipelotrichaceae bacterium]
MEKIKIAKIINTHALKGELKLDLYTDFPFERFKKGNVLSIFFNNQHQEVIVEKFRIFKNFGYIIFKGYEDINRVLPFKNHDIYIDDDQVDELDDGYYFHELIGLEVFDETNNSLGIVNEVVEGVTHNNIRVISSQHQFLVPFIDEFIIDVDLNAQKIVIKLIEGLL